MPPKKKPIKPKKKKPKKKTKPKTTQKQSQKQVVNQIVKVYLDERKKSKRTRTTPQKRNVIPVLSNPFNEMYSFRQPPSINPLTELINKLNANRLGSINEEVKSPSNDQIADMYENKIIPGNPLVEPIPVNEKFPSLDPTPAPLIGDVLDEFVSDVAEEPKGNDNEGFAREVIGDIIDRIDLPDPRSPMPREEQLAIINKYNELRPLGRQGQHPSTMKGYMKSIKRYINEQRRDDDVEERYENF
tara:strand:+ start:634 stop:1365 length:732 start_codon:yes stop_codon:yes gene_type:complete